MFDSNYINKFKLKYNGIVQFAEVDSFNIVHNLRYFYWLEAARIDYFKSLFPDVHPKKLLGFFPTLSVHNEIDYLNPAFIFEEYEVLTRISFIKNSSFGFENLIRILHHTNDSLISSLPKTEPLNNKYYTYIAKAKAILVHIDKSNFNSKSIPLEIRSRIIEFEGNSVQLTISG